jgi:hypothetical protein
LGSFALSIVGFICRDVLPGPLGEGAHGFFSMLATGAFSHGLATLFWQRQLSETAVARSLRAWLALATGVAIIVYLEARGGGFSPIDIAITIAVILVLLPMQVSWLRFMRREAQAQRESGAGQTY